MKRINISTTTTDVQWIYGFPTCGKSTAQRTIRFLTARERAVYGFKDVIDATDTDEWFGMFKKSQNRNSTELETALMTGVGVTNHLKSNHVRVVFTNLWRHLAAWDISPIGIFLPSGAESVRWRAETRGDLDPAWITEQADIWLKDVVNSEWLKKNIDRVVYLDSRSYILDYLDINNQPLRHVFDRGEVIRDLRSPTPREQGPVGDR